MADKAEKIEAAPAAPVAKAHFDFTKLNTLAVVSLATALSGFGSVAAIITGHFSLAQLKRTEQSGRGLALAGLILGYVGLGLWILGGVAMAVLRLVAGSRYGVAFGNSGQHFGHGFGGGMMGGNMGQDDNSNGGMMGGWVPGSSATQAPTTQNN
jgi:hypothetical protein